MKVPVEVALLGFPATLGSLAGWDPNYHARLRQVIAAQRPRDEPPGQRLDGTPKALRRSWPARLHRVVRRPVGYGSGED